VEPLPCESAPASSTARTVSVLPPYAGVLQALRLRARRRCRRRGPPPDPTTYAALAALGDSGGGPQERSSGKCWRLWRQIERKDEVEAVAMFRETERLLREHAARERPSPAAFDTAVDAEHMALKALTLPF